MKHIGRWMMWAVACIILSASSCKKEIKKIELPVPPTKWERIAGTYKVYDTTGVYLYEMKISHSHNSAVNQDTLKFENFDGEFNISAVQSSSSQDPEYLIIYGHHPLVYDEDGKRWKILYSIDEVYNNVLLEDTIKMNFGKTNINYYLSDLTPYYSCDCKQVAVKQH